jgi:hypothetical protein
MQCNPLTIALGALSAVNLTAAFAAATELVVLLLDCAVDDAEDGAATLPDPAPAVVDSLTSSIFLREDSFVIGDGANEDNGSNAADEDGDFGATLSA